MAMFITHFFDELVQHLLILQLRVLLGDLGADAALHGRLELLQLRIHVLAGGELAEHDSRTSGYPRRVERSALVAAAEREKVIF